MCNVRLYRYVKESYSVYIKSLRENCESLRNVIETREIETYSGTVYICMAFNKKTRRALHLRIDYDYYLRFTNKKQDR